MARLPRLAPVGISQHIIQRGNNRQACFCCEDDFVAYADWLRDYAEEYRVQIHAWVFMTNHVHLLATPQEESAVASMMQSLGRMYVRYFNRAYRRSGTLWEGRYKSCLVQSQDYLLHCYRYIELNPVRAGIVSDPAEYYWSSYASNALGRKSGLLTPHAEYLRLGRYPKRRRENYRALFSSHVDQKLTEQISSAVNKGLALGSDRFKEVIERQYGRRVTPVGAGRPRVRI